MELTKQHNDTLDVDNQSRISAAAQLFHSLSIDRTTRFEYLPNEVIYEIFQFIELFQLYNAFGNLNIRFQNLLTNSTFPIEINDLSASKSTFDYCWTQIILSNPYRVQSLHLSNPFILDQIFSSVSIVSQFIQLKKLTLFNIDSLRLEKTLIHLASLPRLLSLTILPRLFHRYSATHYLQIFRLPLLKYCKLSFRSEYWGRSNVPLATNEFSPIEHLVLNIGYSLNDLHALLSYVPHLKYLSIDYRGGGFRFFQPPEPSTSIMHLTHVSLNCPRISFCAMQHVIRYLSKHVQVLHITSQCILEYLEGDEWERLILNHMPHLRICDVSISRRSYNSIMTPNILSCLIFKSLFWFERKWFIQCYYTRQTNKDVFLKLCSIHPYRRKQYYLIEESIDQADINDEKIILKSVHQIEICNRQSIRNCIKYFPNATELTISCSLVNEHENFLSTNLNRIIPLDNLSKLVLHYDQETLFKIFDFMQYTPNIQTLEVVTSISANLDFESIQQNESFRLASRTNNIRYLTINYKHKIQETKFWVNLCPHLHQLTFRKPNGSFKLFIRSLLLNDNKQMNDLFFICITDISEYQFSILESLIKSEKLFHIRSLQMEHVEKEQKIYLWW